jgi:hypothetical protein
LRVGYNLALKCEDQLKILAKEKQCSLISFGVSDEEKSFKISTPVACTINIL